MCIMKKKAFYSIIPRITVWVHTPNELDIIVTRRLATTNRSRVSIRVTKVFGQGSYGPWSTVKRFSSHLIWSQWKIWLPFFVPCACMKEIPKMEDAGTRSLVSGACMTPRSTSFPIRYHAEFGRYGSNRMGICKVKGKVCHTPILEFRRGAHLPF